MLAGLALACDTAAPPAGRRGSGEPCRLTAERIAVIMVDAVRDPARRAQLAPMRASIVSELAGSCSRDRWSEPLRACFLGARTDVALQECDAMLRRERGLAATTAR